MVYYFCALLKCASRGSFHSCPGTASRSDDSFTPYIQALQGGQIEPNTNAILNSYVSSFSLVGFLFAVLLAVPMTASHLTYKPCKVGRSRLTRSSFKFRRLVFSSFSLAGFLFAVLLAVPMTASHLTYKPCKVGRSNLTRMPFKFRRLVFSSFSLVLCECYCNANVLAFSLPSLSTLPYYTFFFFKQVRVIILPSYF